MNKFFNFFGICDCGMEVLNVSIDSDKPYEGVEFCSYWTLFSYASKQLAWWVLKNKIKGFLSVLLFGNTNYGKSCIILDKEQLENLLKSMKKATGYKPKTQKHVGLFGTYFKDFDTFNLLFMRPDAEDGTMHIFMCPNYLMWGKCTRWAKAWKILKDGCWTISGIEMDEEETKMVMDYLSAMLKLDWREYEDEKYKID